MMLTRRNFGRNFFEDFFNDPLFSEPFGTHETSLMKTDVQEDDAHYLMDIELPGFDKQDIRAQLKNGYLTITAEKMTNNEETDEKSNYVRRERYCGSCQRSFYVGDQVKQEDINAAFENGILKLMVPKEAPKAIEETPNYIPIG